MTFDKKKVSALSGDTEVIFTLFNEGKETDFRIIASPRGVRFEGRSPAFAGKDGAEVLAQTIGQAFTEYMMLKPRIVAPYEH
jgi:hypothetical protein